MGGRQPRSLCQFSLQHQHVMSMCLCSLGLLLAAEPDVRSSGKKALGAPTNQIDRIEFGRISAITQDICDINAAKSAISSLLFFGPYISCFV